MRKSLLPLLSLAILGTSAAMAAPSLRKGATSRSLPKASSSMCMTNTQAAMNALSRKAPAKAASELWLNWGYCSDPYNAFSMPEGEIKCAIMLTKDIATQWAGAELSAIQVPNPTNQQYDNPLAGQEVTVWLSESLDKEPFVVGKGELGDYGFEYTSIELDKPYALVENTPVYIGYTLNVPNPADFKDGLFTLVTDYTYPDSKHSAYLYSTYTGFDQQGNMQFGDTYAWKSVGDDFGNICITATLSGDMLPQNQIGISDYLMPSVVKPGQDFDFVFISGNSGANKISNIDLTFDIKGEEPQVKRVDLNFGPLSYNQFSRDTVAFKCETIGNNIPFSIRVSAINGSPVDNKPEAEGYLLCINKGFDRNVVFEEATGTWCGWCVVGYAGMEYMKEKYSNNGFIGIAMHQGDRMSVLDENKAYAPFAQYAASFPSAFMDRNWGYDVYPSPENLEYEFLDMVSNPAFAKIDAELFAEEGSKDIKVVTKTKFAESEENAKYGIAYTVVEDNVGPYNQTNYPSGSGEDYYGFENEPNPVSLIFNDVARNCSHPVPFDESLPASVSAGTEYEYTLDINLKDVKDLEKYRVVAMVVDGVTGRIQNACVVSPQVKSGVMDVNAADSNLRVIAGKGCVTVSNEANADIYSSDGRIVAKNVNGMVQLPAGLYIVNAGNKAEKVIVRW